MSILYELKNIEYFFDEKRVLSIEKRKNKTSNNNKQQKRKRKRKRESN